MKSRVPVLFLFILIFSLCIGAVGVFAADTSNLDLKSIMIPQGDKKYMKDVWLKMGTDGEYLKLQFKANADIISDTRLLNYDDSKNAVVFNNSNFNAATDKSRKNALGIFIEELQKSPVSAQTQQIIIDTMSSVNSQVSILLIPLVMDSTTADVFTAMKWLNPILPVVRVIFGMGAILISLLLIGSSIMDLVYIGLPIARESMDTRSEKNGKPRFVSNDALSVVKETEASLGTSGAYKNAYLLYLKRRALTYIILAICLLYLISGELGGLIAWILKLGSGVV
ncbi:hypothetical protein [Paenibacillus sp. DMB5]|uniref:hypothetical protein n=1 Tax=Paenibacillus sp. DMB5 TaxID=1780103 RepID=UPI00076BF5D3|nr:hypothetical protein [Paenibacillus sp. DMB5]KUP23090.1 hypothetical protein AWJ19_22700 [Paenibacillus sp. DMB5]